MNDHELRQLHELVLTELRDQTRSLHDIDRAVPFIVTFLFAVIVLLGYLVMK